MAIQCLASAFTVFALQTMSELMSCNLFLFVH